MLMRTASNPTLELPVPPSRNLRDLLYELDRSGTPLPPFPPGLDNDQSLEDAWEERDDKQPLEDREDDEASEGGYHESAAASAEAESTTYSPSHLNHIGEAF